MIAGGVKSLTDFAPDGGEEANVIFRKMVEALPVAIYMTDAKGRLTYFNAAAVKLSGRVPELGTDQWCITWKLFLPDGTPLPHDQCPMAIALRGGDVPNAVECIAERPDGTRFWFTPHPAVLRDSAERIVAGINLLMDISDRKKVELEAHEQFRTIVETTPECVEVVAPDGTLLFMNTPGLAMVNAPSADTVIGRNVHDFIAPEDQDRFGKFNEKICRGEKGSLEFNLVGLTGVRRHVETHAAPLHHLDGTVVHLAITRDISERKRTEGAAMLLSAIVDSSDDAIISKDLSGILTSWNQGAERIFGYTAAEAIGQSVTILIPPDRLAEEPTILERLKRGESVSHFETIRRRKDGTLIDISLTISPVKGSDGTIIGASKIARDITERKRAEGALLASEAKFRQLSNAMPQIVWTACPDGDLDYYNDRWFEFTGRGRNTVVDWESILHPDDVPFYRETWHGAVASGKPYNIEYRLWDRRESRWRWFMGQALPACDTNGNIVKWFGSCTDIDDRKRVEYDLRQANDDLEQFAYSACHDLQEPLRSIKIYSELLMRDYARDLDGPALKLLTYLVTGSTRMQTLVGDLLSYTQITKFEPLQGLADGTSALKIALANLAAVISETGARIAADQLPSLPVYDAHLQQLFQNLIGNAIKYRSPDRTPEVRVSAERRHGCWLFAVSDNGIGIAPEHNERIFGLFNRLHTRDEYSGTGLGLAICKRIVDRYRGEIWVESKPAEGSTFLFTLPA